MYHGNKFYYRQNQSNQRGQSHDYQRNERQLKQRDYDQQRFDLNEGRCDRSAYDTVNQKSIRAFQPSYRSDVRADGRHEYTSSAPYNMKFRCTECGRFGHDRENCRKLKGECFRCGSREHYIRSCPDKDMLFQERDKGTRQRFMSASPHRDHQIGKHRARFLSNHKQDVSRYQEQRRNDQGN